MYLCHPSHDSQMYVGYSIQTANSTWLNCTTQNDTSCAGDIHVQSEINVLNTFSSQGMGAGDTPAYYTWAVVV